MWRKTGSTRGERQRSTTTTGYTPSSESSALEPLLPRFKHPSLHMRRGIDFGQRDLGRILDAVDNNKQFAVMSGIKPTGVFHLGHQDDR